MAAGTLDASTKIYAVRVDAVHADAYRVLGGLGAETKPGEGWSLIIPIYLLSCLLLLMRCRLSGLIKYAEWKMFCGLNLTLRSQVTDHTRREGMKGLQRVKWLPNSQRRRGLPRGQWSRT